jgi:hypothetical protein
MPIRDLLHSVLCRPGNPPGAIVRAGRILEEVLEGWWDDDEVVGVAEDDAASLPFCFPDEEPHPAA